MSDEDSIVPEFPTITNVSFPYATPPKYVSIGAVTLSQDEPLSVDLTIFPETPPVAIKVLFPNATSAKKAVVEPEVLLSQEVPLSDEVKRTPL